LDELNKENKSKMMGFRVNEAKHSEILKFCEDRNWKLSRFLEIAVTESMQRVVTREKKRGK